MSIVNWYRYLVRIVVPIVVAPIASHTRLALWMTGSDYNHLVRPYAVDLLLCSVHLPASSWYEYTVQLVASIANHSRLALLMIGSEYSQLVPVPGTLRPVSGQRHRLVLMIKTSTSTKVALLMIGSEYSQLVPVPGTHSSTHSSSTHCQPY